MKHKVYTFDMSNLDYYNKIHALKSLRSTKLGCKDIRIRKSDIVKRT